MQPEMIAQHHTDVGENPLWHPIEKRLYWTDITGGKLFWYDPATGHHQQCYSGPQVGGFTFQPDGALLLFMDRGQIAFWRDGVLESLIDAIPEERESRFNDVIADPVGRVFCGTMATPSRPGRLYRLDQDGTIRMVLEGIACSNGMGFTLDRRQMYYTDSVKGEIYLFDYDIETGALTNQRLWLKVPEGQGLPDGMTVDAEGHVWSARWGDSALYRYSPEGVVEQRITFPALKVSSVVFGDDDYQTMYVTTALSGGSQEAEGPGAGGLFRLRSGVSGLPEFYSRIRRPSL